MEKNSNGTSVLSHLAATGTFFLSPATAPPDSGPKSKFQGGVPYWFRPFRGLPYQGATPAEESPLPNYAQPSTERPLT
jgi:hypothetical protein